MKPLKDDFKQIDEVFDQALSKVMQTLLKADSQVYKQFVENESFKRFVSDMVFEMTCSAP